MNKLIFEPQEYARLYNCNHFHIEEVAIEKRQHFYKPVLLITLATITMFILYVPCKLSIHKHRANSCYKILLFMSIANVCNVCLLGYVNGYLSLVGAVFCSSPTFSYVVGCVALSLWAIETVAEIILSLNRCLVMMSARLEAKLF
uniref:G-protein coupled receptors family 1 profile domain-containing protein n=1 Tax=Ditylenchus dipsaci TaxID=166011 RepID=A0A915D507_9BILA